MFTTVFFSVIVFVIIAAAYIAIAAFVGFIIEEAFGETACGLWWMLVGVVGAAGTLAAIISGIAWLARGGVS